MREIERHLTIVVATTEFDNQTDYDDCYHDLSSEQRSYGLDEILAEDWFIDILRNKGFYSKDEITTPLEYLDKFVYKIKKYNYIDFKDNISTISEFDEVLGVYQEVVGPERIKAFSKWKKKRDGYLEKEKERLAKEIDKKKQRQEKRRCREIEKAKKILEEEGIIQ